jgi:tetratricopeptide (TPR) repeat protein
MNKITVTVPEAFKRALAAYEAGKLAEAGDLCKKILAAKHDHFDAIHLLAVVDARSGHLSDALANFDKALMLRPDYAEALNSRGLVLRPLGRFEEGLAGFDKALALRPDHAEAFHNRGDILRSSGVARKRWPATTIHRHAVDFRSVAKTVAQEVGRPNAKVAVVIHPAGVEFRAGEPLASVRGTAAMGARARTMLEARFTRRHAFERWRDVLDRIG